MALRTRHVPFRKAVEGERFRHDKRDWVVQPSEDRGDPGYLFCANCCRIIRNKLHQELHCSIEAPEKSFVKVWKGNPANHVFVHISRTTGEAHVPCEL